MKTSSRAALVGIAVLLVLLWAGYRWTRPEPERLTVAQAQALLGKMTEAVEKKDTGALLASVSSRPEVKLNGLHEDQVRLLLGRAFRSTGRLKVTTEGLKFSGGEQEAQLNFHVTVKDYGPGSVSDLYNANMMMKLRREEVSHWLGLAKSQEWRIVEATSDGPSLDGFSE